MVAVAQAAQHVRDAVVGDRRQAFGLLVEHRQPNRLPALDASGVRRDGAGDQAEQGGLAGAVGSDDAGAFAGGDAPFDIAQHRMVVKRDRHVEQVDDVFSEPRGGQLGQLDAIAQRRHVGDQLIGGLDAKSGLRGPRGGAAAEPGQLFAHQVLPLGLGGGGHPVALDALQHVSRVPALKRLDDPVVHLPGHGGDLVEEPAIVRHQQQPAGVARPALLQVADQPGDAFDVQMVGGLVEGDDVPIAGQ